MYFIFWKSLWGGEGEVNQMSYSSTQFVQMAGGDGKNLYLDIDLFISFRTRKYI